MTGLESQRRQQMVAEALTWLCTPYHDKGVVKGVGVDCAQFPGLVYYAVGLLPELPPTDYASQWHLHRSQDLFLAWVLRYCREIFSPPQPGDFALYHFGRNFSHGAIVLSWPQIIHAVYQRAVELGNGGQVISQGHLAKAKRFFTLQDWER